MITPAFTEFAEYQNMRNRLRTRKRSECGEQAARGMVVAVRGEAALRERVRPNVQKVRHQTLHLFFFAMQFALDDQSDYLLDDET
mmetsp:Transcript_15536/g.39330  ORF Transcript_15536/g.39330 Transcript_15536/m.39330 type:complete len:85 (+) Transcript_15536:585-839(+)